MLEATNRALAERLERGAAVTAGSVPGAGRRPSWSAERRGRSRAPHGRFSPSGQRWRATASDVELGSPGTASRSFAQVLLFCESLEKQLEGVRAEKAQWKGRSHDGGTISRTSKVLAPELRGRPDALEGKQGELEHELWTLREVVLRSTLRSLRGHSRSREARVRASFSFCLRRWLWRNLHRAFSRWAVMTERHRQREAVLAVCFSRASRRVLHSGLLRWRQRHRETSARRARVESILRAALLRHRSQRRLLLQRWWLHWRRSLAAEDQSEALQQTRVAAMARARRRGTLARSFRCWRSYGEQEKGVRSVLVRALYTFSRSQVRALQASFLIWSCETECAKKSLAAARTSDCASQQARESAAKQMFRLQRRVARARVARAFLLWRTSAPRRAPAEARHMALATTARRWYQRETSAAFYLWIDTATQSARAEQALRKVLQRCRTTSLTRAIRVWRHFRAEAEIASLRDRLQRRMLCERSILEAQSATIRENGVRQALVRIQHVLRRHRGNQLRHAWHRMQLAPYETAVLSATGLTDPRILSTLDAHLSQRAAEDALQQRRGRARLLLSHIAGRTQRVELLRGWLAWMRFAHGAALERVRLESRQSVGALEGRLQSRHESQRQRALARCERRTQHATLRKGWRAWAGALQRWRSLEKGLRVLRRAAARIGSRRASRAFAKWRVVAWATRDAEEATMAAEEVDARELASKMALTRQVLGRCDRRLRQGRVSRALSQWRSCVLREERAHGAARHGARGGALAAARPAARLRCVARGRAGRPSIAKSCRGRAAAAARQGAAAAVAHRRAHAEGRAAARMAGVDALRARRCAGARAAGEPAKRGRAGGQAAVQARVTATARAGAVRAAHAARHAAEGLARVGRRAAALAVAGEGTARAAASSSAHRESAGVARLCEVARGGVGYARCGGGDDGGGGGGREGAGEQDGAHAAGAGPVRPQAPPGPGESRAVAVAQLRAARGARARRCAAWCSRWGACGSAPCGAASVRGARARRASFSRKELPRTRCSSGAAGRGCCCRTSPGARRGSSCCADGWRGCASRTALRWSACGWRAGKAWARWRAGCSPGTSHSDSARWRGASGARSTPRCGRAGARGPARCSAGGRWRRDCACCGEQQRASGVGGRRAPLRSGAWWRGLRAMRRRRRWRRRRWTRGSWRARWRSRGRCWAGATAGSARAG